jgi:hypothetical protein
LNQLLEVGESDSSEDDTSGLERVESDANDASIESRSESYDNSNGLDEFAGDLSANGDMFMLPMRQSDRGAMSTMAISE